MFSLYDLKRWNQWVHDMLTLGQSGCIMTWLSPAIRDRIHVGNARTGELLRASLVANRPVPGPLSNSRCPEFGVQIPKTLLERLRSEAAEYALIRDLATDPRKRERFTRLASDAEAAITANLAAGRTGSAH
jgi:hypothetical protein